MPLEEVLEEMLDKPESTVIDKQGRIGMVKIVGSPASLLDEECGGPVDLPLGLTSLPLEEVLEEVLDK